MRYEKIVLSPERESYLTLYLQENKKAAPLVLVLPGGYYETCSPREGEPVALKFFTEGFHTAVLNYSVGDHKNIDNAMKEVDRSIEIIKTFAEEHKIEEQKLIIVGFSAGGHLAALYASTGKTPVQLCILGYPVIDSMLVQRMNVTAPPVIDQLGNHTPNTFLFTTYEDSLLPLKNFLDFQQSLDKAGVPFESHIFQKGKHGLALGDQGSSAGDQSCEEPQYSSWFTLAVNWIHQQWEKPALIPTVENQPISVILKNKSNKQLLANILPELLQPEIYRAVKTIKFKNLHKFYPQLLSRELYQVLLEKLFP